MKCLLSKGFAALGIGALLAGALLVAGSVGCNQGALEKGLSGPVPATPQELMAELQSHDLVIGSRYLNRSMMMKDKSWLASYVSFFGQVLTRFATGFRETDASHSFRMFKKSVFERIKPQLENEGNVFLIEFLIHAKRHGCRVTEIPIEYGKRVHGETKLRVFREGVRYLRYIATIIGMRVR